MGWPGKRLGQPFLLGLEYADATEECRAATQKDRHAALDVHGCSELAHDGGTVAEDVSCGDHAADRHRTHLVRT
jgi:hypothetical protein